MSKHIANFLAFLFLINYDVIVIIVINFFVMFCHDIDLEPAEFTPEHIHQTEPLFLAIHAIVSSIIKSAKEDCKQEVGIQYKLLLRFRRISGKYCL